MQRKLLILAIISAAILIIPSGVFANHLLQYKRVENPPTVNYCLNPNLGALKMGYAIAELRIRDVVKEVNDITSSDLLWIQVAFNSNCKNQFVVSAMDPYYLAYTYRIISNGKIVSSNIHINYNIKNWITSGCVTPSATGPFNFLYTMRHELGHTNGFGHSSSSGDPTVMYPAYSCAKWSAWSSHDVATYRSAY